MRIKELRNKIEGDGLSAFSDIYEDRDSQRKRFLRAISEFSRLYGEDREVFLLSAPGRSELLGNHTDHNNGCVLAAAIDKDVIAVVSGREDGIIRLCSDGYGEITVDTATVQDSAGFERYTVSSLVAGVTSGFERAGYRIGGYDAYVTSEVLRGSGLSSSAAFEVMLGNILNHLYNGEKIDNLEIAKIAKYAENEYFGKPSGLMDQCASALGGLVFIDFESSETPRVERIDFSLADIGYSLCVVNTGGSHADLNDEYASVPREMLSVASALSCRTLRECSEEKIIKNIGVLRNKVGDRAILRSLHFLRENERVLLARNAIKAERAEEFFALVRKSGDSSFEYLQNVYNNINIKEQGISLALALSDGFLGETGAYRLQGGGFAGTVEAYVPKERCDEFSSLMDGVFGAGATMKLNIRPLGACRLY